MSTKKGKSKNKIPERVEVEKVQRPAPWPAPPPKAPSSQQPIPKPGEKPALTGQDTPKPSNKKD